MVKVKGRDGRGAGLVKIEEIEKIGLVEWFEVRKHSRQLYVPLDRKDCAMYDIREGDRLRMKMEMLVKALREEGGE